MTKTEFLNLVNEEKKLYLGDDAKRIKQMKKNLHKRYCVYMYLYYFRCCQYYRELRQDKSASKFTRKMAKYRFRHFEKKRNIFSYRSGVEIGINSTIGRCCDIWHSGVVINGNVGDFCVFHGNNTVGNKGIGNDLKKPTLKNGVDVGVGAVIIGDVTIADNCIIGAGAVVTKSFEDKNSIIVGIPGKKIN